MSILPSSLLDGKVCAGCHRWHPFSEYSPHRGDYRAQCKPCRNAANREYKARNAEKVKASNAAYREANRDTLRVRYREWRKAHPERDYQIHRKWKDANPEKRKAQRLKSYHRDLAKSRAYVIHRHHIRRVRLLNLSGSHTIAEWEALKAQYGFKCLRCGRAEPQVSLTRDHVVPVAKGGGNDIGNIQPLCKSCNCRKHTKTVDYRPAATLVS